MLHDTKPSLEELAHYGVKGMRWGVRRSKEERARDRKAKREDRAKKYDTKADILDTKISDLKNQGRFGEAWNLEVKRDQARDDAQAKREGKLSRNQKRVVIGAAVVGTYFAFQSQQAGDIARLRQKGKEFMTGESAWKKNPDLAKKNISESEAFQIASGVNPNFGLPGTTNNCRRATYTYEMRRRGYDVQATRALKGRGQTVLGLENATTEEYRSPIGGTAKILGRYYKDVSKGASTDEAMSKLTRSNLGKERVEAGPSRLFETLAKQPDGARGELGVTWTRGGAHSMAWEIIGGKPVIIDTQTHTMYKSLADMTDLPTMKEAGFTRLDDISLNEDFLKRWARSKS